MSAYVPERECPITVGTPSGSHRYPVNDEPRIPVEERGKDGSQGGRPLSVQLWKEKPFILA